MRRAAITAFLFSLVLAPIGISSPMDGSWGERKEVTPSDVVKISKTYRGGERACVMVVAGQQNAANLHLKVFDEKGALVAEDKNNSRLAGNFLGAVWYPPRDGAYRIEVQTLGAAASMCYIAIK